MFNLVGTTLHLQFLDSRKEIYSHKEIYFFPMTKPVEGVTQTSTHKMAKTLPRKT